MAGNGAPSAMSSPSRISAVAIAAFAAVAGCSSQPVPVGQARIHSAELPVGGCAYVFERFHALNCSERALARTAEQVRLAPGETARSRFRALVDERCAQYAEPDRSGVEAAEDAPSEVLRAKVDACLEEMDRRIAVASRAREQRIAAARGRADALRADERYPYLRARLAVLERDARAAREAADAARLERHWNLSRFELEESSAAKALEAALDERDALLRDYGIDPRDARDLGLF